MVHQPEKFDHFGIVTHTKTQFIVTSWSRRYNLSRSVYRSLQLEHSENIQGPKKHTPWFQMAWLESQKNSVRASGEFCKTRLWHIADLWRQKTRHPAAWKESKVTMEDSRLPAEQELLVIKMGTLKNISMS